MNNVFERLFGIHIDDEPMTPNQLNDVETLNLGDYDGAKQEAPQVVYEDLFPLRVVVDSPDGYSIVSHGRWYGAAEADATGVAVVTLDPPNVSMAYLIDRIGTYVTNGTYTQMLVTEGAYTSGVILDVSMVVPDIADESQPIWQQSLPIDFTATGMTPGARLIITVQYRMARRFNESVGL